MTMPLASRTRRRAWLGVRAVVTLSAFVAAFVDGLGFFLSPGQAVVWAIGTAAPHPPDSRWGIFLGLVFYAALAFVSVVMRAQEDDEDEVVPAHASDLDLAA